MNTITLPLHPVEGLPTRFVLEIGGVFIPVRVNPGADDYDLFANDPNTVVGCDSLDLAIAFHRQDFAEYGDK